MTTIRVAHRERFAMMDRRTVRDKRLSFKARGILLWVLDHHDDWRTTAKSLATESTEGEYAIRSALTELEEHGYLERAQTRGDDGQWETEWIIHEVPATEEAQVAPDAETAPGCAKTAPGSQVAPGAKTASSYENERSRTTDTPPAPPQAGGGLAKVVEIAERQPAARLSSAHPSVPIGPGSTPELLQTLTGGSGSVVAQLAAALAAGGWTGPDDVPDMPAAVAAYWESLDVKPHTKRSVIEKRGREAARGGQSPGQFLATLCGTNTYSPLAMDLARNRVSHADMSAAMLGVSAKPKSAGPRGDALAAGKRKFAARLASERAAVGANAIDVDGWES